MCKIPYWARFTITICKIIRKKASFYYFEYWFVVVKETSGCSWKFYQMTHDQSKRSKYRIREVKYCTMYCTENHLFFYDLIYDFLLCYFQTITKPISYFINVGVIQHDIAQYKMNGRYYTILFIMETLCLPIATLSEEVTSCPTAASSGETANIIQTIWNDYFYLWISVQYTNSISN